MAVEKELILSTKTKGTPKAVKNLKDVGKATSNLKKGMGLLKKAAIGLGIGFAAVKLKAFAVDSVKAFADFESAAGAMSAQFGKSSDEIIKSLREVSGGTISNTNLILAANRSMALNVTKDVGEMGKLLEFARLRGRAMGLDTTQAFNDIVTGIGRGSPLILDNLGIITKGWAEEAKSAGVAYDAQFILNKVLEQAADVTERVGDVQLTAKEKMAKMRASIDNLKVTIGMALLPVFDALVAAFAWIQEGLGKLKIAWDNDWGGIRTTLTDAWTFFTEEILPTIENFFEVIKLLIEGFKEAWDSDWLGIRTTVEVVWQAIKINFEIAWAIFKGIIDTVLAILQGDWQAAWDAISQIFKDIWDAIKEPAIAAIEAITGAIDRFIERIKEALGKLKEFVIESAKSFGKGILTGGAGILPGMPRFQHGGLISAGQTAIVGEAGPEIFTPRVAGNIIPNHALGGQAITINISGVFGEGAAEEIGDLLLERLKMASAIPNA